MDTALQELTELARDLLYMSETDAPLVPFLAAAACESEPTDDFFMRSQGLETDVLVTHESVEEFLGPMAQQEAWFGDEDRAIAQRFQCLIDWIGANLTCTRVLRIGEIEIVALLVGKTNDGQWLGLRTSIVET